MKGPPNRPPQIKHSCGFEANLGRFRAHPAPVTATGQVFGPCPRTPKRGLRVVQDNKNPDKKVKGHCVCLKRKQLLVLFQLFLLFILLFSMGVVSADIVITISLEIGYGEFP